MSKCYGCKQDVSGIGLPDLVFTWQEFIMDGGPELLEVPWHKLCYANELSEYNIDNFDAAIARAEQAEAALAKAKLDYLRVLQESAGYCADAEEAMQLLNEWQAEVKAVPVDDIRRAMADTTAQHYSWYEPIRRWLDSLEVRP